MCLFTIIKNKLFPVSKFTKNHFGARILYKNPDGTKKRRHGDGNGVEKTIL